MNQDLVNLLALFGRSRVLVLGDLMLDRFVYGIVERVSPEAPIPILHMQRAVPMPGGAANVARNIASLGGTAHLIGVTGEDADGKELAHLLNAIDLVDADLIVDTRRPTTTKTRYVADGQQIMRADSESRISIGADTEQQLLDAFGRNIEHCDVVVLSDYAKGLLTERLTSEAISIARRHGKPVIVDPKTRQVSKYRGATVITPNRAELEAVCGHSCETEEKIIEGGRRSLADGGIESAVVTRGADGMSVIYLDQKAHHLRTVTVEVFDVSGAGDTVVAALALGLAAGGELLNAAKLANLAAGIVVGKPGTAVVSASEVIEAIASPDVGTDLQKIYSLERVLTLVRSWRDRNLRVAFANGCFDLLHPGHISLLSHARASADRLIVGINSDQSVRRLKGPSRPVQGEIARATVLASLKAVDAVVIFGEDTPLEMIRQIEPDVLVKGTDYRIDQVVGADLVQSRGGRVLLVDLVSGHSTSATLTRVSVSGKQ